MKFFLPVAALVAVVLAFVAPVHAAPKSTTFKPVISEVGKDTIKVRTGAHAGYKVMGVGDDGLPRQEQAANVEIYAVNQRTKITLNGKLAKLTELKNGMEVRVTAGVDRKIAAAIEARAPLAKW